MINYMNKPNTGQYLYVMQHIQTAQNIGVNAQPKTIIFYCWNVRERHIVLQCTWHS
jgi:hypothetical protein